MRPISEIQKRQIRNIHLLHPDYSARHIGLLVGLAASTIAGFRKREGLSIVRNCKHCGNKFVVVHGHQIHCMDCRPKMKKHKASCLKTIDKEAVIEKYNKILDKVWEEAG